MAKTTKQLNADQIREIAREGAREYVAKLKAEIVAIERTFPELFTASGRTATTRAVKKAGRRVRKMSAAGRKAVSQRMKRYWAERRKAKKAQAAA